MHAHYGDLHRGLVRDQAPELNPFRPVPVRMGLGAGDGHVIDA
jgi:hypothetical protein